MRYLVLCSLLLTGCAASDQWTRAHQACQGDPGCQNRVEAKQAAVTAGPAPALPPAQDPPALQMVPLPRPANTCTARNTGDFPTTRCY